MAAMMYNSACYCLLNETVCIQPLEENYQPPEHLKSFIPESMKEVWGMVIQASRCIHEVIGVMEWLIGLKCAPDIILHFWRQLLSGMDYKVDNEYGRSRNGVNFIKERYQNNGRPFEYKMDKYPNLYAGALIDELCTNARWNISVR